MLQEIGTMRCIDITDSIIIDFVERVYPGKALVYFSALCVDAFMDCRSIAGDGHDDILDGWSKSYRYHLWLFYLLKTVT